MGRHRNIVEVSSSKISPILRKAWGVDAVRSGGFLDGRSGGGEEVRKILKFEGFAALRLWVHGLGMEIFVESDRAALGARVAREGAEVIRAAIESRGVANIIVATGASQFEVLDALARESEIAWNRVTGFHLDEYIGLPMAHGVLVSEVSVGAVCEQASAADAGVSLYRWGIQCGGGVRSGGGDFGKASDRCGFHRDRGEWTYRVRRPAGGF